MGTGDHERWGAPSEVRGAYGSLFRTSSVATVEELPSDLSAPQPLLGRDSASGGDVPDVVADRYERRERLGSGGMGEVWRVFDRRLQRPVALKVIHRPLVEEALLTRFEEEARVTAQLQHPGIIPVHDVGRLDDGRLWFAMKEVRGRTLEVLLQEVHRAWRMGLESGPSGFTFRRMLEGFLRVCETMAYAHSQGVVHRDLKPSNIMVGPYGELLVVDWGLAKAVASEGLPLAAHDRFQTQVGAVTGTPAYMSPEQARGASGEAGPPADVYSLGATLYDLLCERPPRLARSPQQLVLEVAVGTTFPRPRHVSDGPPIDEELERICLKALETEIDARYPHAGAMADDLANWLDDARKREKAMELVDDARARMQAAKDALETARAKWEASRQVLSGVPRNAPIAEKRTGWALEDDARSLEERARSARTEAVQQLRSALSHAPDLLLAHDLLADHFVARHAELEAAGADQDARQVAKELALHDRSGRFTPYLRGTGALTLITDPPGVEVRVHRFVFRDRRLVPEAVGSLGSTPLVEVPLEMGSYLLTLHRPGHEVVSYPVHIERQEHWHGVPPGGTDPHPIWVPRTGDLSAEEAYVPAGWFWWGDDGTLGALPPFERRWSDGFVIGRFPVTVGAYGGWLNRLLDDGRIEEAEANQPTVPDSEEAVLQRTPEGRFQSMRNDKPGWESIPTSPRAPMVSLTVSQAMAYASDAGAALPTPDQWVRAGRGSDRRLYPWGDAFDPTWCRMRETEERLRLVVVDEHPEDSSPFGVRGLAGNVADWVVGDDGRRWRCGGFVGQGVTGCRLAHHVPEKHSEHARFSSLAFRVVRRVG